MEGLIPYVYRAIVRYRAGGQAPTAGSWFKESPASSFSYVRLPGDSSGRFQPSSETSNGQAFRLERVLVSSTTSPSATTTTQSLLCRTASRRPLVS